MFRSVNFLPLLFLAGVFLVSGCRRGDLPRQVIAGKEGSLTIHGDVWADNWFALYIGDELLIEDSVSINTERSFNAESFSFKADYPIVLNFIVKDFKENDSGLEYIGTKKQQMGDGGFIAQFTDAESGELLAATDSQWKCYVIHRGPLDESCVDEDSPEPGIGPCQFLRNEEPESWKTESYSAERWQNATIHSSSKVRPKGGYDQINWNPKSKLIWSEDLEKDNTLLIRFVIEKPE